MSWDVGITTIPERDEDYSSMYGDVNTLMGDIQKVLDSLKALAGNGEDIPDNTVQELAAALDGAAKSTDGTFAANSDTKLPTEKAVKTYVSNNTVTADDYSCLFYPSYQNLAAKPNSSNPNSQVDMAWDELRIENRRTTSQSFTLDITQSGALGLDTGSEAVSTWYYIWAICNDAGTTVSAILSASATSLTLPSGYTKKRLISAVYNMADGHFRGFEQINTNIIIGEFSILSGGTMTSLQSLDITTAVPINAISISGFLVQSGGTIYIYSDSNEYGITCCGTGGAINTHYRLPLKTHTIYWKVNTGSAGIKISSYEINI